MDFSEEMTEEILKIFQIESEEIINKLYSNLSELEKNPKDKDAILNLFRDAHSLKGASRMVGFNNIQTISHKMEDLLGLVKEDKLVVSKNLVNTLYQSVDFLAELIQKSLEKGHEIFNDDISKKLLQLQAFENAQQEPEPFTQKEKTDEEKADFDLEMLAKNQINIDKLISKILYLLIKIEIEKNKKFVEDLHSKITELYEIFKQIGCFSLKKPIEDVKVKLDFIQKVSSDLTSPEAEDIHRIIDTAIVELNSIYELYNMKVVDHYSYAFEKISQSPAVQPKEIVERQISQILEEKKHEIAQEILDEISPDKNIEKIKDYILNLQKGTGSISELNTFIVSFINSTNDENVKNIISQMQKIFDFAFSNEIKLDEETISILVQSLYFCEDLMKNKTGIADSELIIQRLSIVEQVLEISAGTTNFQEPSTKSDYSVSKKPKNDFSKIFNTGEIKTLRVDSEKLDTLVNQVNELTVTKIKSKKHIQELQEINKDLAEWQRSSLKTLSYLKYYEKKHSQTYSSEHPINFFLKQLLSLFSENNKKVQETITNITTLRRTIQEDETKTSLIVDNLEHMIKNVRVLPLATVFHLFGRMVRDIAQEKGKQIELEILGSETCTDKKILEEIKTPLIHIIRNSIDHGIETPSERESMGKNPVGKIVLSARQNGNKVFIEIKDDGRGINIEKIKDKAVQKGYLTQEEVASMSNEQLLNLIFMPGFSTGDQITNISGRGIGLDVVQTKISQLNGKLRVMSELNKGCVVQIELPTTMSTLKAFLVQSCEQTFAIPMEYVNIVVRKKAEDIIISNNGKRSILYKDTSITLLDLSEILNLEKQNFPNPKETVLIIENDNKLLALSVDKLIGDQEILHKKLSKPLTKVKNISGLTTLASGDVCLILSVPDIINSSISDKQNQQLPAIRQMETKGQSILLVDDSITTRTLEKNILQGEGYKVEISTNPIEAFSLMKTTSFDLIITDMEMPEMNGLEFIEKIKTDEMYSDIPVIVVSSVILESEKKKAYDLGIEKFINKAEFSQSLLLDTIKNALEKNQTKLL